MTAIAIFVKTPGHSAVKTRLAKAVGADAAERFYMMSAHIVGAVAVNAAIGPVYWAVAEPEAAGEKCWSNLPVLAQGAGGLGERMSRVHAQLFERHGAGILLGADTAQIEAGQLQAASRWLSDRERRLAVGPAADGGFWLFGANSTVEPARWTSVPYSRSDTLSLFQDALHGYGLWLTLNMLTDVDRAEDIPSVAADLRSLSDPLPEQAALADELDRILLLKDRPQMNTDERG